MTRPFALLAGLLALGPLGAPLAAELPAPLAVLPWGDGPGEPGLLPGGGERPPVGPVAVAADDAHIVVSDPAHRQLLLLDLAGNVVDTWRTDFAAVDLALLPDGRVLALDALGDRAHVCDGLGPWRPLALPAGAAAALVAAGPGGTPWVIDALGRGHALEGAAVSDRATPLGPDAPWHATGRRAGPASGELLLWRWPDPAEVRPPGPALTLPVRATDRLLGSVRPVRVDASGALHAAVETLAPGPQVSVRLTLHRFALPSGAPVSTLAWDVADVAPINRPFAVTPSGVTIVIAARPEGLTVWRVEPPTGGAR